MSIYSKFLISGGALVAASGTSGGIYYLVSNKDNDKVGKNQEEKISGYLIFEKVEKKNETSKKIYKANLSTKEQDDFGDKECKLEDNKNLVCKISDLNDKKNAKKYLETLNSSLETLTTEGDEKLLDKLKQELKTETVKGELIKFFGQDIYDKLIAINN